MRRPRRRPAGAAVALALIAGGLGASQAQAAPPTKIVHVCGDDLCAVDPVTGRSAAVTTDGTADAPHRSPSINPAGTRLASIRGTRVLLGDLGGARRPWGPERSDLRSVAITPDGRAAAIHTHRVAWISSPRCFWTPGGMQCDYLNRDLVTIEGVIHPAAVDHAGDGAGIHADGRLLLTDDRWDDAAGASRSTLCIVADAAVEEHACAARIEDPGLRLADPAGSPNGRLLAATAVNRDTDESTVTVYDAATGAVVRRFGAGAHSPSFSPDSRQVAFAAADGRIHVGTVATGVTRPVATGTDPTWGRGDVRGTGPTVTSTALRRASGRIAVSVRCPAGGACAGVLRVEKGRAVLAAGRYRVAAGRTATVRVRPSARGARLIARATTHRVRVVLRPAAGAPATRTLTLRR